MAQAIHPYEKASLAQKYNDKKAEDYYQRYQKKWARKLANYFDHRMALKALKLAGNPTQLLDFPCGTGRFWQGLLKAQPKLQLIAADYNVAMIEAGLRYRSENLPEKLFAGSLFSIPLEDNAVQSIFCMRYFHHIGHDSARNQLFKELHRVTRETVIFSVYIDQGLAAKRWHKKHANRQEDKIYNEYLVSKENLEASCYEADFEIVGHVDLFKGISPWRTYVLRKKTPVEWGASKQTVSTQLVCPACKGELISIDSPSELLCLHDKLAFPIQNDLPVLVLEKARLISLAKFDSRQA